MSPATLACHGCDREWMGWFCDSIPYCITARELLRHAVREQKMMRVRVVVSLVAGFGTAARLASARNLNFGSK